MRQITFKQAINEAMSEEMRRDESVFLLGEDVGVYGGAFGVSAGMYDAFGPDRVMDTPISEAAIAGAAVGAAMAGLRPIAEIMFSDFTTIAIDQLVNQAAKMHYMFGGQARVPMVLRTAGGSGTGAGAQHSQSLEAWFCHIPGLKVVMPSTPYDAKGLLKSAIRDDNPVVFLEQKLLYKQTGSVPDMEYTIPLGQADVKKRGTDLTLIVYGRLVSMCLDVAAHFQKRGISIEVVDPMTLSPLDTDTLLSSVKKTGRAVIVHEACKTGGFGAEIAALIAEEAFQDLKAPVKRVCGLDVPIPYARDLESCVVPTFQKVTEAVESILK